MSRTQILYDKMEELGEFEASDLKGVDIGKSRIGTYIFMFRKRGLIKTIGRGRYSIVSNQAVTSSKYEILYGIELELEYDSNKVNHIRTGRYHGDESVAFNNYFIAENDGSLRTSKPFGEMIELVGIPSNTEGIMKGLRSFKRKMCSKFFMEHGRMPELNEIITFNNTTGAHIHISLKVNNDEKNVINMRNDKNIYIDGVSINPKIFTNIKFLKTISKSVKANIKREMPEVYKTFIESYFRKYAKRMTDRGIQNGDRYMEYNFNPDNTIEYRSLNLRGIQTWNQLFTFYKIVCGVVDGLFAMEMGKDKPFIEEKDYNVEVEVDDNVNHDVDELIENTNDIIGREGD